MLRKIFFFSFLILTLCVVKSQSFIFFDDIYESPSIIFPHKSANTDEVLNFAKKFIGTKYRAGGKTPSGFDCSGFVGYVFKEFGIHLPASSKTMAQVGSFVAKNDVQKGDLIFFQGSAKNKSIGHVGIIWDVNNDGIFFIHASSSSNVTITNLNKEAYYQKRYVMTKRINLEKSISKKTNTL